MADAACEFCGASVRVDQLLWHEASHDQMRAILEEQERINELTAQALQNLHDLVNYLEGELDAIS